MTKYATTEEMYDCFAHEHKITLNECRKERYENIATRWHCPAHDQIVHVEYDALADE